jgi:phenylpropionate dioxygenase-like ring-hydroxylating dioxygenase large terminal subunit
MELTEGFRKEDFGLIPVRLETWKGFVFINFDRDARSFEDWLLSFTRRWQGYDLQGLREGGRLEYEVAANWKILTENYLECYHCAPIHPELTKILDTNAFSWDDDELFESKFESNLGPFSGNRGHLAGDFTSMTKTGYRPVPSWPEYPKGSVSFFISTTCSPICISW